MSEFEFIQDLPETRGGPRRPPNPVLVRFAEALRGNPGQWAKYPNPLSKNSRGTMSHQIRTKGKGCPVPLRDTGFEAANRGGAVYVRYVKDAQ